MYPIDVPLPVPTGVTGQPLAPAAPHSLPQSSSGALDGAPEGAGLSPTPAKPVRRRRWRGHTLSNIWWEPAVKVLLSLRRTILGCILPAAQMVPVEVRSPCHSSDQLNNSPLFWLFPLSCSPSVFPSQGPLNQALLSGDSGYQATWASVLEIACGTGHPSLTPSAVPCVAQAGRPKPAFPRWPRCWGFGYSVGSARSFGRGVRGIGSWGALLPAAWRLMGGTWHTQVFAVAGHFVPSPFLSPAEWVCHEDADTNSLQGAGWGGETMKCRSTPYLPLLQIFLHSIPYSTFPSAQNP